jgi:Alpha/beta hydrolase family
MRRPNARLVGLVLIVALLAIVGGIAWWLQPQPLLPEAEASLASTPDVAFTDAGSRLEWTPTAGAPTTGLIVYPGAKVPAPAYGPLAQAIAGQGFLVVIEEMPLNLAILGVGRADEAIFAHPEIRHWAIGGHSLGGSMAAQYASEHLTELQGLVFWASYGIVDLSASQLKVVSTWGSLDAGAARMSGPEAQANVPSDATFVEIPGGNHEQMGWYTGQPNDPPATISREDQQRSVAASTVELLRALDAGPQVEPGPSPSEPAASPSASP